MYPENARRVMLPRTMGMERFLRGFGRGGGVEEDVLGAGLGDAGLRIELLKRKEN